jgi:hypothetical protein
LGRTVPASTCAVGRSAELLLIDDPGVGQRHLRKDRIDRTGLVGCTALDLFNGRIYRMSVKFDTFQMGTTQYEDIRTARP